MLKLKKIAVTGGLASGKSSVCRFLKELGAYVVSADELVHQLLSPNTEIGQKIVKWLGSDILKNNTLDRSKIATIVFSKPDKLEHLEKLLHPAVYQQIENRYKEASAAGHYSLFVAEIPLLLESNAEHLFDFIVVVNADLKQSKAWYNKQHKKDMTDDFNRRMARQHSTQHKEARAHFVIENRGSLADLREATNHLYQQLQNKSIH